MNQKAEKGRDAFARIVTVHQKAVFAVAYSRLRNVQDAEDVVQDVFVEALKKLGRLKNPDKILPWFFRAVNYRCTDHIRSRTRRNAREQEYSNSLPPYGSYDHRPAGEPSKVVMRAVNTLPEKYRLLVMLKHFARLSYTDISRMTGLPKTTIDGRLRIAKKRLRAKLADAKKELIESGDL